MEDFRPMIVTLGPSYQIDKVLTFDEATEGYSNANGKHRRKKAARKSEKTQYKKKRKLDKIEARNEVKSARGGNRRARRGVKQNDKAQLKTNRKTNRFARRAIGDNDNPLNDGEGLMEESLNNVPDIQETGPAEPSTIADQVEESGENWGGAQPPDDNGGNYGEQDEEQPDMAPEDSEETDEENDQEQEDEYPSSFDGVMGAEDRFSEFGEGNEDTIPVPEAVLVTAIKAEWNKEALARLQDPKYRYSQMTEQEIKDAIDNHRTRVIELTSQLDGYAECKGDFSNDNRYEAFPLIDTMYSDADGSKSAEIANEKSKRARQVKKARMIAKKKRDAVTIVRTSLNPIIQKNRIEVPAAESNMDANGVTEYDTEKNPTGLNGLDNINDSDAPDIRTVELSSNMSGSLKNINWKGVVIGVAIGGLIIYGAKKYKLI